MTPWPGRVAESPGHSRSAAGSGLLGSLLPHAAWPAASVTRLCQQDPLQGGEQVWLGA